MRSYVVFPFAGFTYVDYYQESLSIFRISSLESINRYGGISACLGSLNKVFFHMVVFHRSLLGWDLYLVFVTSHEILTLMPVLNVDFDAPIMAHRCNI
jgi:hypothetical protein